MPSLTEPQERPSTTGGKDVATLVHIDIEERIRRGEREYGTRLETNNGRDALIDFYQELLDGVLYLRQHLEEIKGKQTLDG